MAARAIRVLKLVAHELQPLCNATCQRGSDERKLARGFLAVKPMVQAPRGLADPQRGRLERLAQRVRELKLGVVNEV